MAYGSKNRFYLRSRTIFNPKQITRGTSLRRAGLVLDEQDQSRPDKSWREKTSPKNSILLLRSTAFYLLNEGSQNQTAPSTRKRLTSRNEDIGSPKRNKSLQRHPFAKPRRALSYRSPRGNRYSRLPAVLCARRNSECLSRDAAVYLLSCRCTKDPQQA